MEKEEVGSLQLAVYSWQFTVGSLQLAVYSWQLAVDSRRLSIDNTCDGPNQDCLLPTVYCQLSILFNIMRIRLTKTVSLLIATILVFLFGCTDQQKPLNLHTITGSTMGTTFVVKVVKEDSADGKINYDKIEVEINRLLVEVNRQMSTYIEDSEISRFNQYRKTDWFPVSSDLANVLSASITISEKSQGAFDVTIGPLVNLWGFGPDYQADKIPDNEEIMRKKALTGFKNLPVKLSPPAVKKNIPEIYCDFSAIAKGFGVDKIAFLLDSLNIENYMVEIGGEIRTKGKSPQNKFWRIGIEAPDSPTDILRIIEISDNSMATSGDYRNYFEKDGVRYSHTIDPRVGRPIAHKLASVTVIHESCMIADGMATAINVLGPDAGYELALREGLPIFMIVRETQGFTEKMTPEFKKFLNTH